MDIKETLRQLIARALKHYLPEPLSHDQDERIVVEVPRNREFGDFATNVAMVLAKTLKKNPMVIAEELLPILSDYPLLEKATAEKPGFINFVLVKDVSAIILTRIAEEDASYGTSNIGKGKRVLIEFVSANPTGPLHIGHARNTILGDSIARVLEAAGYDVAREYYYNDGGVQMRNLGESLKARYLEILGEKAQFPEGGYQGLYMVDIAKKLNDEVGDTWKEADTEKFTQYAADEILKTIDADLKALGIAFDAWFSEMTLHKNGEVDNTLQTLKDKGYIYEKDGAAWLATSKFNDEKDRVVIKSDGEKTYLSPDIAYHKNKFERGYDILINLMGGDHHGYVPRLRAAVTALGYDPSMLHFILYQMVTLLKGGEKTKLSTRAGEFITLKDMRDELGIDVVRFFFITRSAHTQMVFDWELAKEHSMNNPVYYVQYAHARFCSLFKKAEEMGITWPGVGKCDLTLLTNESEQDIIKTLARFPEVVERAARTFEPHILTVYVREVAELFHQYFTLGTKNADYRFILPDNPELSHARLALIHCLRIVIRNTLSILGISAPESM